MRRIVMFNWVSIDGLFTDPNGEISWLIRDPNVEKTLREPGPGKEAVGADTMLLGSITYAMFEGFWPHVHKDPNAPAEMRSLGEEITRMTKIVFSRKRKEVTWKNSKLVRGNLIENVKKLKGEEGTDIIIFGSGTIVQQLTNAGLIDDYFIVVTPVLLGAGKPLFSGVQTRSLRLLDVRHFQSGNVLLHYRLDEHPVKSVNQ